MTTFATVRGNDVPQAAILKEGYEINLRDGKAFSIRANISAEKIDAVFRASLMRLPDPLVFILESPCNQVREIALRKQPADPFHRDVYFMDGLNGDRLLKIYSRFRELLIHDGFINFGVQSRKSGDEVFVGAYKIFNFFGRLPNQFEDILAEFAIPKNQHLTTAWDTFTNEAPGNKTRCDVDGISIYDMLETLIREHGLFHAKTVEG